MSRWFQVPGQLCWFLWTHSTPRGLHKGLQRLSRLQLLHLWQALWYLCALRRLPGANGLRNLCSWGRNMFKRLPWQWHWIRIWISVHWYMLDMDQLLAVHSLSNCCARRRGSIQAPTTNICSPQFYHKTCGSFLHQRWFWNSQNSPKKFNSFSSPSPQPKTTYDLPGIVHRHNRIASQRCLWSHHWKFLDFVPVRRLVSFPRHRPECIRILWV